MAAVPSNSAQQLESKLQGVAADFRQRRDKAHRAQQLALERLRLANDECIAVQASVAAAEKKLKETTHFASLQQQDCSNLQSHVNHLTNEVRKSIYFVDTPCVSPYNHTSFQVEVRSALTAPLALTAYLSFVLFCMRCST